MTKKINSQAYARNLDTKKEATRFPRSPPVTQPASQSVASPPQTPPLWLAYVPYQVWAGGALQVLIPWITPYSRGNGRYGTRKGLSWYALRDAVLWGVISPRWVDQAHSDGARIASLKVAGRPPMEGGLLGSSRPRPCSVFYMPPARLLVSQGRPWCQP